MSKMKIRDNDGNWVALPEVTIKGTDHDFANRQYSERGKNWFQFAIKVLEHVEKYTVPQYGDKPNDQIEEWSIEDCFKAVKKRMARFSRNSREGQQELDFMKMAHEIQIAAEKWEEAQAEVKELDKAYAQAREEGYDVGNLK